jgi:protein arginine kinase activator
MGMKCEVENCENEATVHLTEIRDGKKHEMHLCERCASEKGLPGKSHFSISELLAGIASQTQSTPQKSRKSKEAACPTCSTTIPQFQASGRFGCPDCYTTFKDDVQGLVEKIHDSSQHLGKIPKRLPVEASSQKDIQQLQNALKQAIRKEDYEKAASIRDQLRKLEEELQKSASPSLSAGDTGATGISTPPAMPPEKSSEKSSTPEKGSSKKKPNSDGGEKK